MKMVRRLSMVTLFVAVSLIGSAHAFGETVLVNPFGNASIWLMVGMNAGVPKAVWLNRDTGACAESVLGDSNGLNDDYLIAGSNKQDIMYIMSGIFLNRVHCNLSLTALVYNGYYVDLAPLDNPEPDVHQLIVSGSGPTWVFGGNGREWIVGGSPMGRMLGGPGMDTILGLSSIANDWLEGQAGSDCLGDSGNAHHYFDCGSGDYFDRFVAAEASGAIDCEVPVDYCD